MKRLALFGTLVAALLLTSCSSNVGTGSGDENGTGDKPLAGATVTMYSPIPEQEVAAYVKIFEQDTGINVSIVRLGGGEVLSRVRAEKDNPQASVWFGGATGLFLRADADGLLEEVTEASYPGLSEIPVQFKMDGANWVPAFTGLLGFLTNDEWAKTNNIDPPQSWESLLEADFADNVMLAHPATSGTSLTTLMTLISLKGEDAAFDYLRDFDQSSVRQWTKSGAAPVNLVGQGETGVAIAFIHDELPSIKEGYPMSITYPSEGTGTAIEGAAVIKNAPEEEREAAQAFISWLLSEKGQSMYADAGYYRAPLLSTARQPEGLPNVADIEIVPIDEQSLANQQDRLLERFDKEIVNRGDVK
ncbi:ABC transporter substrate-binding protein [Microbacterium sp. YY-01]|uniref:ABC transporter substrate-binding protein n=1 Tax=Microbacterium sp. YY-01 TaxID=3421634 RepID=UPI003D1742A6